jgi:Tfp pilus assembly protein PilO
LTTVLQGVQDRARSNNLSLRRFTPKDDVQQDQYSGKQIEVGVTSSFANLRAFFDQIAHYQRIVSITNFEIKQLDKQSLDKTVDAKFDMTAYYVSAEKLQKQANGKPAGQGGQATTPASPPAK